MKRRAFLMAAILAVAPILTTLPSAADDTETIKDFDFSFSPDGHSVFFYSYRGEKRPDIFVRSPHAEDQNLTNRQDTWDIEPDVSPDGHQIVYSSGISMRSTGLRIMNVDGSGDRQLFDGPDSEVGAEWSPDGSHILFTSFNLAEKRAAIFVMKSDGTEQVELTAALGGASTGASWSPDGSRIAFIHGSGGDARDDDVYIMNADGSHVERLTSDGGKKMSAQFTPDGSQVIYSLTGVDQWVDLYAVPVAGLKPDEHATRLTNTPDASEYFPAFTPNGAHLVFSRGDWENGFGFAHIAAPVRAGHRH